MSSEPERRPVRRVPREPGRPRFLIYAGFVSRAMAAAVDLALIFGTWLLGGLVSWFVGQTSGISQIVVWLQGFFAWVTPLQQLVLSTLFEVVVLLTLGLFYFTFFYTFGGATPGKYLMGLRVVRSDGRPMGGAQAALRTIAYAASSLPVYLGFLSVLVDDRRRAWHDMLIGTAVVHTWRARPDERFLRTAIERVDRRDGGGS